MLLLLGKPPYELKLTSIANILSFWIQKTLHEFFCLVSWGLQLLIICQPPYLEYIVPDYKRCIINGVPGSWSFWEPEFFKWLFKIIFLKMIKGRINCQCQSCTLHERWSRFFFHFSFKAFSSERRKKGSLTSLWLLVSEIDWNKTIK